MRDIGQNPLVIGVFLAGAVAAGAAWVSFALWLDRQWRQEMQRQFDVAQQERARRGA